MGCAGAAMPETAADKNPARTAKVDFIKVSLQVNIALD